MYTARRRTVLGRGWLAVVFLLGLGVLLVVYCYPVLHESAVKTVADIAYSVEVTTTNTTSGSSTTASEERSYRTRMNRFKWWTLTKALFRHGAWFSGFATLLAGVAGLVSIVACGAAVLQHKPRYLMSQRWAFLATIGRLGFFFPLYVCLYAAVVDDEYDDAESSDALFGSTAVALRARWKRELDVSIRSGTVAFTAVLIVTQLLVRSALAAGRTPRNRWLERLLDACCCCCRDDVRWSLRSKTQERRGARPRGFTTVPILCALAVLAVGLWTPVAAFGGYVEQTVSVSGEDSSGDVYSHTFVFKSSKSSTDMSAWILGDLVSRWQFLFAVLLRGLVVFLPLARSVLALLLWLVPMTTAHHRKALIIMDFAGTLVCHDVFALVVLFAACDLERFVQKSLDDGVSTEAHNYRFRLQGWVAALLVGCLAEHTTSHWITWRLAAELSHPESPARIQTFASFVRGDADKEEVPTHYDVAFSRDVDDDGDTLVTHYGAEDDETKAPRDDFSYQHS